MSKAAESPEIRRLLNPAFTAAVVTVAADGYCSLTRSSFPFAYCYLITPLVLHSETRDRLPTTMATKLVTWSERNGDLVAAFGERLAELVPFTSRGILTATTTGLADLAADGGIVPSGGPVVAKYANASGSAEVAEIIKKSTFTGKWLAAAGTPATIFTALGVSFGSDS
jgi:hypothetical protein